MNYEEDAARHEVYLARLATGLLNAHVYPSLDEALKAARRILAESDQITSEAQLIKIIHRLDKEMVKPLDDGWNEVTTGLTAAAVYESEYTASLIEKYKDVSLKVPPQKQVKSFINDALMTLESGKRVTTNFWESYVKANKDSYIGLVKGEIAKGYEAGLANSTIIKRISEVANNNGKTDAENLVRTGMNFYSNQARESMAAANANVITYREHEAVFDNRTCPICRPLSGKRYPITEKNYPKLPLHFSCRCYYTYGTGDINEKNAGTRAAVGGKAGQINPARKLKYRGKKDLDIFKPGQIDAGITQDEWLRQQPEWFIESSLGKTRAKLFKEGGLKIEKFVDMAGKPLTLEELRKIDANAFKKAGL
jgi:SPP1 gp7 family putative phage head morphogenesis protein